MCYPADLSEFWGKTQKSPSCVRRPSLSLFLALAGPLLAKHPSLDSATVQMLSPIPEPLKRRAPCKLACAFAEGKQLLSAMVPAAPDDPSSHVCLRKASRSCTSHTGVAGSVRPPGECVCKWSVRWSLFSLPLSFSLSLLSLKDCLAWILTTLSHAMSQMTLSTAQGAAQGKKLVNHTPAVPEAGGCTLLSSCGKGQAPRTTILPPLPPAHASKSCDLVLMGFTGPRGSLMPEAQVPHFYVR